MIARRWSSERPSAKGRWSAWRFLLLATCAVGLVLTPGCGGCLRRVEKTDAELLKEEEERLERLKEQKEKPPLEARHMLSQPNEGKVGFCWCKPGHWTAVTLFAAKANHNDFDGELEVGVVDRNGNPQSLEGMGFTMSGIRPAPLPKGQPKNFEAMVFVPGSVKQAKITSRLLERRSGRTGLESTHPVGNIPPSYQYHFVVLARLPGSYGYLKELVCFRNPGSVKSTSPERSYYRLTYQAGDQPSSLPAHSLYWTSIAYVLWDDADSESLRPDQQIALLDWLHWGGQLIISGPDSLDRLGTSFLSTYLPATSPGRRNLTAQDIAPLSDYWSRRGKQETLPLIPAQPWAGAKLTKHPEARYVPGTGDLVVERRVGRGRIVVTAFPLTVREIIGWKGFDSFFNSCLLGRPARHFYFEEDLNRVTWADAAKLIPVPPRPRPDLPPTGQTPAQLSATDPARTCQLRYFTRDTQRDLAVLAPSAPAAQSPGPGRPFMPSAPDVDMEEKYLPDVGSWRDFNAVAGAARTSLQSAAAIEVPDPKFVLWVLGGYLLVLVPVNWAFFRLLGRVEWAWVAAPVIAVLCTVVVIRMARLDIGFARSLTEIAVVELQGDYQRAHVTRYSALYTSLTTNYRIWSEDPGVQIQPFPREKAPNEFRLPVGGSYTSLRHRQGTQSTLERFFILSNSTSFLHSEQMVDLGGPIGLSETPGGEYLLTNRTDLALRGVGVLRNNAPPAAKPLPASPETTPPPNLEVTWLDTIEPGASVAVRFQPAGVDSWAPQRSLSPQTTERPAQGDLNLRGLINLAQASDLEAGEIRLVGWVDQEIAGLVIQPVPPQARRLALVVAHLRFGPGLDPRPDLNTLEISDQDEQ